VLIQGSAGLALGACDGYPDTASVPRRNDEPSSVGGKCSILGSTHLCCLNERLCQRGQETSLGRPELLKELGSSSVQREASKRRGDPQGGLASGQTPCAWNVSASQRSREKSQCGDGRCSAGRDSVWPHLGLLHG